jgi:hypothetical protein
LGGGQYAIQSSCYTDTGGVDDQGNPSSDDMTEACMSFYVGSGTPGNPLPTNGTFSLQWDDPFWQSSGQTGCIFVADSFSGDNLGLCAIINNDGSVLQAGVYKCPLANLEFAACAPAIGGITSASCTTSLFGVDPFASSSSAKDAVVTCSVNWAGVEGGKYAERNLTFVDMCSLASQSVTSSTKDCTAFRCTSNDQCGFTLCQQATCVSGRCQKAFVPNGELCDKDANLCTVDACDNGLCKFQKYELCNSTTPCLVGGVCIANGGCQYDFAIEGTPCTLKGLPHFSLLLFFFLLVSFRLCPC